MAVAVYAPIILDDEGIAYIEGTTAKVTEVALTKITSGLTPEQVQAELPHLTLAQVYAALAYYYGHQEELDIQIGRDRALVARLRAAAKDSPVRQRLHLGPGSR